MLAKDVTHEAAVVGARCGDASVRQFGQQREGLEWQLGHHMPIVPAAIRHHTWRSLQAVCSP